MELDTEEVRILGCLAEKQLTTPAQYPLTLNALTLACNQATSRDPVVTYDERTVEAAVTRAKTKGMARFFHPTHGRSALRFGHTMDEALGLDPPRLALVAVLMLRGPQTLAELRARTLRMAEFSSTTEVEAELDALARFDPPLARRIGRGPGQKEDRYEQLLGPTAPATAYAAPAPTSMMSGGQRDSEAGDDRGSVAAPGSSSLSSPPPASVELDELRAEMEALRTEVTALRDDVDDLRSQLGV
jgi:uncharacterized protein